MSRSTSLRKRRRDSRGGKGKKGEGRERRGGKSNEGRATREDKYGGEEGVSGPAAVLYCTALAAWELLY